MFKQQYLRDVARLRYEELLDEVQNEIEEKSGIGSRPPKAELIKVFLTIRRSTPTNHRYFYKKYAERFEVTCNEVEQTLGITKEERELLTQKGVLVMRRKRIDLDITYYDYHFLTLLKEEKLHQFKKELRRKIS